MSSDYRPYRNLAFKRSLLDYSIFKLLSLQYGRVCNNSANKYIHYLEEQQDFITILQSYLGKHFGICHIEVLQKYM